MCIKTNSILHVVPRIFVILSLFLSATVVYAKENEDPGQFSYKLNKIKIHEALTFSEWAERKGIFSLYI